MKLRLFALIIAAVFALSFILTACGEDKKEDTSGNESKSDETTVAAETTAILETTSEGGTVEQDPDGNIVTKDKNGKVTEVEDKNGNPITVTEYLTTHSWVENSPAGSGGKSSDGGSGSVSEGDKGSTNIQGDVVEGDIPVIIATIPPEEELIELPE